MSPPAANAAKGRLRRIPLLAWIAGPVALAALIAWPLGGWDTVGLVSRELPSYASNQVLHGHRFDLRIDDAWVTDRHPAGYLSGPAPGEAYFVIRVEATNVSDEATTARPIDDHVIPELPEPELGYWPVEYVLVDDGSTLPELNPGLPRLVELVWTIPDTAVRRGDDLRIALFDTVPVKAFLWYGLRWEPVEAGYATRNVSAR